MSVNHTWSCDGINEVGLLLFSVITSSVLHFAVCTDLEFRDSIRMEVTLQDCF